jgi:hypothetical protein
MWFTTAEKLKALGMTGTMRTDAALINAQHMFSRQESRVAPPEY